MAKFLNPDAEPKGFTSFQDTTGVIGTTPPLLARNEMSIEDEFYEPVAVPEPRFAQQTDQPKQKPPTVTYTSDDEKYLRQADAFAALEQEPKSETPQVEPKERLFQNFKNIGEGAGHIAQYYYGYKLLKRIAERMYPVPPKTLQPKAGRFIRALDWVGRNMPKVPLAPALTAGLVMNPSDANVSSVPHDSPMHPQYRQNMIEIGSMEAQKAFEEGEIDQGGLDRLMLYFESDEYLHDLDREKFKFLE